MASDEIKADAPNPEWLQQIIDTYKAGISSTYLVHGNVFDYATYPDRDLPAREFVSIRMGANFTIVNFAPHEGITFIGPSSLTKPARERFLRVVGLGEAQQNETQQLLADVNGGGAQPEVSLPATPGGAIPLLVKFLEECDLQDGTDMPGLAIVDRLDLIAPPSDKGTMPDGQRALLSLMHSVGSNSDIDQKGNILIMFAPTLEDVHPDLRMSSSSITFIEIKPPDYSQRLAYAQRQIEEKGLKLAAPLTISEIASQTAGLTYRAMEDISMRAVFQESTLTRELIRERKAVALRQEYDDVIEVLEPNVTLDMVGGHDLAKDFIQEWIIEPMRDEDLWDQVPLGILFLGPPGTGKTFLARAIATESGLNCVLLRADKIKGSLVGESERRLAKAIAGIEALSPCVVFLDEIDQKIRRAEAGAGDGGSAVEANIFGRLLEFFGDTEHRGRIIAIAASNRPDLVDAALKRAGRFDTKVPLLPPDNALERAQVLYALLPRYGFGAYDEPVKDAIKEVAGSTDLWTQAELERLVSVTRGLTRIRKLPLAEALRRARARLKANTREIERMTRLALAECDDQELVPEKWRQQVAAPAPKVESGPTYTGRGSGNRKLDL